jgi:hypothetical protein
MLTFIIPLRARALAKDWPLHLALLERTVDSILAQSHPAFAVAIVCHDVPEIRQVGHPAVHVLRVGVPLPQRTNDDMCADKVIKLSRGVDWANDHGSDYVMFVDADDLVSRRLSAFVAEHPAANGWYLQTGFVHRYGDWWMRAHAPHHLICGTSAIIRTNLLRAEPVAWCRGETVDTLAAAGHDAYLRHMAGQGAPLAPLPFAGAVYVLHDDSLSEVPGGVGHRHGGVAGQQPRWRRALGRGKRVALDLPTLRPITPHLRAEFTIPRSAA